MSVALIEPQQVVLPQSLELLAEEANTKYSEMIQHLAGSLQRGIECGLALLQVREILGNCKGRHGEGFRPWAAENLTFHEGHAWRLMYLAKHREHLPEEMFKPWTDTRGRFLNPSAHRAVKYLDTLDLPEFGRRATVTQRDRYGGQVLDLRKQGFTMQTIAEVMGISQSSVNRILHPDRQKRDRLLQAKARRETRELRVIRERQDHKRLARKKGGSIANVYSLLRQLAEEMQAAMNNPNTPEEAQALRAGFSFLYRLEDRIGDALRDRLPPAESGNTGPQNLRPA